MTLSTAGVVPKIDALRQRCRVSLAVSLHAPNDRLRDELVPLNKHYPIRELLAACRRYVQDDAREKVTFEYVLLQVSTTHNSTPANLQRCSPIRRPRSISSPSIRFPTAVTDARQPL